MNKILMPTDFSAEAIVSMEKLFENADEDFDLLFTHLFYLPDGIQDLLFGTYRMREYKFVSDSFIKAYFNCIDRKQWARKQTEVPVKFFYGNTLIFFKNFISANGITHIAYDSRVKIRDLNSSSIRPESVIFKCGLPVLDVEQIKTRII